MYRLYVVFFFNDTATTEIYTLSLHDALPILVRPGHHRRSEQAYLPDHRSARWQDSLHGVRPPAHHLLGRSLRARAVRFASRRSEEHTSELQSRQYLVCRLLLEKKKK